MREWLKEYVAFVFYGAVFAGLISAALLNADYSALAVAALLAAGLLSWALLEYSAHRFAFHSNPKRAPEILSSYHLNHHRHPDSIDDLFMELHISIPIAASYYLLAWLTSGSWKAAAIPFCGLLLGYFVYEYVHYQVHHGSCRWRPLRYMKDYHLARHHRAPRYCFGLTSPLMDLLFGTFRSARRASRRKEVCGSRSLERLRS